MKNYLSYFDELDFELGAIGVVTSMPFYKLCWHFERATGLSIEMKAPYESLNQAIPVKAKQQNQFSLFEVEDKSEHLCFHIEGPEDENCKMQLVKNEGTSGVLYKCSRAYDYLLVIQGNTLDCTPEAMLEKISGIPGLNVVEVISCEEPAVRISLQF